MDNLIRYCCDKGIHNFMDYKLERKSRIVMKEHFVSKKDVLKYDLIPFIQVDRYGRYKIPKYLSRKISAVVRSILCGYICVSRRPGLVGVRGGTRVESTLKDVPFLLLNPNEEVRKMLDDIQEDLDKDLMRNRAIKIWNIKKKMNY